MKSENLIIATLGPSSLSKDVVKKMDRTGVDIFRINLSHVDIDDFEETIMKIKSWTDKTICPDTEGAQLRTGNIKNNDLYLEIGSIINFTHSTYNKNKNNITLNIVNPDELLAVGDLLRIDFDSVITQIIKIDKTNILARVIKSGNVGSNKGIAVDRSISLPRFTKKDLMAFEISKQLKLETFSLSFCSSGEDVLALRQLFDYRINVISKVESDEALKNLSSISKESDALLIDRGDLSRNVPLTKIAFAQSYILENAKKTDIPVYVATNLVESMVKNPEPNRAEINDIVQTLQGGAKGLVLAAESAIGLYPIECVRVLSSLIKEINKKPKITNLNYLLNDSVDEIIKPHGGKIIQQFISEKDKNNINMLQTIIVDQKIESDVIQIANGTYSPISKFMNYDELVSVLNNNELANGIVWTMPIIFQIDEDQRKKCINNSQLALKSEITGELFAIIEIDDIEKVKQSNKIAKLWFGTDEMRHPGVKNFMKNGKYILSGSPYLIKEYNQMSGPKYDLSPIQTRNLFRLYRWSDIIGYHTRNIPHKGHEYIQMKALEETNADGIFISPVTGMKKNNDFTAEVIISCYEKLIQDGFYNPFGVLLGSFNTFSRYSGPREAVFTAICRKNYGCNHFIVGRDHTGVADYYSSQDLKKYFNNFDLGMNILFYNKVSYCPKRNIYTDDFQDDSLNMNKLELSGSLIRKYILNGENMPEYLMRPSIFNKLLKLIKQNPKEIFHK